MTKQSASSSEKQQAIGDFCVWYNNSLACVKWAKSKRNEPASESTQKYI